MVFAGASRQRMGKETQPASAGLTDAASRPGNGRPWKAHLDADLEGVGDADGDRDDDRDGEADRDGDGLGDSDGDGMARSVGDTGGTIVGTVGLTGEWLLCLGDGELPARLLADSPPLTVAGVLAPPGVPSLDRTARVRVGVRCEPANMSNAPLTTTAIITATAAAPWLLRPPSHLASPTARENHPSLERRVPCSSLVSVSGVTPAQRLSLRDSTAGR